LHRWSVRGAGRASSRHARHTGLSSSAGLRTVLNDVIAEVTQLCVDGKEGLISSESFLDPTLAALKVAIGRASRPRENRAAPRDAVDIAMEAAGEFVGTSCVMPSRQREASDAVADLARELVSNGDSRTRS